MSFLSLLTLILAIFLLSISLKQLRATGFSGITPQELESILNKTITDSEILFPFIIGLIVWVSISVLTVHYVSNKRIGIDFAIPTVILGGLGLHLLVWCFEEIKDLFKNIEWKGKGFKYGLHLALISLVLIFFIPLTITFYSKKVVVPVEGHPIAMLLDKKNTNIIEIFSDGFLEGLRHIPYLKQKILQFTTNILLLAEVLIHQFLLCEQILVSIIYSNLKKIIPKKKDCASFVQRNVFLETFMQHMNQEIYPKGICANNTSIIDPINLTNKEGYTVNTSGSSREIMRLQPKWNVTNWSGARDSIGFGINKYSPDKTSYIWLNKNMYASKTNEPARIFITDLITRPPMMNRADGTYTTGSEIRSEQWTLVRNNLIELTKVLKKIKNHKMGITTYDNTMIIMYGNHNDHRYEIKNKKDLDALAAEGETLLVMKYPFQQQKNPMI